MLGKVRRRRTPLMLRLARSDDGFGITEVVVASTIMMVALSSLAYVATNALSDVALARHRVRANSIMDEAIERTRALPYDTVKLGHRTSDLDAHLDDVTEAGSEYRFEDERIPHGVGVPDVSPLVPLENAMEEGGVSYRSRTYVTYYEDDPLSGVLRITTLMTWTSALRGGAPRETRSQTIVYSPTGCLSTATHPFSAPCQAFFYAGASVAHAQVNNSTPDDFFGEPIIRASLDLTEANSSIQLEQLALVRAQSQRSNVTLTTPTSTQQGSTGQAATRADNDPSSAGAVDYQSETLPNITGNTISKRKEGFDDENANSIRLIPSAADTGRSRSATAADATHLCEDTANIGQTDQLPCSEARGRQANVMRSRLRVKNPDLGHVHTARVGMISDSDVDNVRTFTKHYLASNAGEPCDGTSGAGCVHARAERRLGTVMIGGLPTSSSLPPPSGWVNGDACIASPEPVGCGLFSVNGFSTIVTAEAGNGADPPSVPSYSGTISYWNGEGYSQLALQPEIGQQQLDIPEVVVTNGIHTVRLTASLTIGGTTLSPSSTCTGDSCSVGEATANSPVLGTITYDFCFGGACGEADAKFLTVTTDIDLGTTSAKATYEDPPDA